jgi:glucose-6-phosphate 1-dehydrogenase
MTEAYVALRINIENWRWEGVPFYLRMGKQLPRKATEISIHFKRPPHVLFNRGTSDDPANVLVIRIQPDEGISLRVQVKIPGPAARTERVKMDFHYANSFGKASPEAYERLLLDAMAGDATLFARRDEVEYAWRYIDEIERAWHEGPNPQPMYEYPAGSWGPEAADICSNRTTATGGGSKSFMKSNRSKQRQRRVEARGAQPVRATACSLDHALFPLLSPVLNSL